MADVFISYSTKDRADAEFLLDLLRSRLLSCWMAPVEIQPGEHFSTEIPAAIAEAKVFLILVSEHSQMSTDVTNELHLASNRKKPIFAVMLDRTPLCNAFEYYISKNPRFDGTDDLSAAAGEAAARIHAEITRQALEQQQKIDRPDLRSIAPLAWILLMGALGSILIGVFSWLLETGRISPDVFLWSSIAILILSLLAGALIRTPLFQENSPLFRMTLKLIGIIQKWKI